MITDYFEERGIEYWTSGKNVNKGWIAIQCVFCGDHSNHLGICVDEQDKRFYRKYSCWLCKSFGSIEKLVMEIEQCSYGRAKKIVDQFWEGDFSLNAVVKQKNLPPSLRHEVTLPPILNKWPKKYLAHLRKKRRFNPQEVISKYRLLPGQYFGRYSHRIIAPFFVDGKMVSFTGMDTTGKQTKYKDAAAEDSLISTRETLYNIDRVRDKVVIVEGVTDVWRIGDGAVAVGTISISNFQLSQLIDKRVRKALILLDSDASYHADLMAAKIAPLIESDIAYLDRDDPDKMRPLDLLRVQKWLSS